MNKRRFISWLFILVLTVSLAIPAFASEEGKIDERIYDEDEFAAVLLAIDQAGLLPDGKDSQTGLNRESPLNGYKLFSLNAPNFLESIGSSQSISDMVADDYVWVVDAQGKTIKVDNTDKSWSVIGYSEAKEGVVSVQRVSDYIDLTAVNSMLSSKSSDGGQSAVAVLCFDAPMYHTSFVLCEIDNSEYLIPYGSRPDLTGLENGKLYTRKEVNQILSQTFGNGYSPNDNAGGPANVMRTLIPIALIASFVFLCVATFLLYRNNKKRG